MFEGRLVTIDKKKNGSDKRVFKLVEGIQFRWKFMFKSHLADNDGDPNPIRANYDCIFCYTDGRGTPNFNGIQTFMNHLVEHRTHLPTRDVRPANAAEEFNIYIISLEGDQA